MSDDDFATLFTDWQQRAAALDQRLRPIVHAPIDINAPDWQAQHAHDPHPADACGLRG